MTHPPREIQAHHPHCLGCGPENPASLGLTFVIEGERVRAGWRPDDRQTGAPGFVHGGAVATAFDDALGTLLILLRKPAVTARLEVDYRSPAFIGREFVLEAWVEEVDGRKLHLASEMLEGDTVIAQARALFLVVSLDHFTRGGGDWPDGIKESWRQTGPELPY